MVPLRSSSSRTSLSFADGGAWRVNTTTTSYIVDLTRATLSLALTLPTSAGRVPVRRRLQLLSFVDCRLGGTPVWMTSTDVPSLENYALVSPPVRSIIAISESEANDEAARLDSQAISRFIGSLGDADAAGLIETQLGTQRAHVLQGSRTLLWEQAVVEASIRKLAGHVPPDHSPPKEEVAAAASRGALGQDVEADRGK